MSRAITYVKVEENISLTLGPPPVALSLAWEFLFWMLSFHGIYLTPSNAKSPELVFICLFIQTAGKRYCFSAQKAGKAYTLSLKKLEN